MAWWKKLTNKPRGIFGSSAQMPPDLGGCDHGEIHLRQGTAEFEWFVARGELEMKGDLKHGANHLANLLSYDPGEADWVALLEQYHVIGDDIAGGDPLRDSVTHHGDPPREEVPEALGGMLGALLLDEGEHAIEHHDHEHRDTELGHSCEKGQAARDPEEQCEEVEHLGGEPPPRRDPSGGWQLVRAVGGQAHGRLRPRETAPL